MDLLSDEAHVCGSLVTGSRRRSLRPCQQMRSFADYVLGQWSVVWQSLRYISGQGTLGCTSSARRRSARSDATAGCSRVLQHPREAIASPARNVLIDSRYLQVPRSSGSGSARDFIAIVSCIVHRARRRRAAVVLPTPLVRRAHCDIHVAVWGSSLRQLVGFLVLFRCICYFGG